MIITMSRRLARCQQPGQPHAALGFQTNFCLALHPGRFGAVAAPLKLARLILDQADKEP